jgi:hypothetical protein
MVRRCDEGAALIVSRAGEAGYQRNMRRGVSEAGMPWWVAENERRKTTSRSHVLTIVRLLVEPKQKQK